MSPRGEETLDNDGSCGLGSAAQETCGMSRLSHPGFIFSVIDEEGESKDLLELSILSHSGMYQDGGKGYVPERKGTTCEGKE